MTHVWSVLKNCNASLTSHSFSEIGLDLSPPWALTWKTLARLRCPLQATNENRGEENPGPHKATKHHTNISKRIAPVHHRAQTNTNISICIGSIHIRNLSYRILSCGIYNVSYRIGRPTLTKMRYRILSSCCLYRIVSGVSKGVPSGMGA